MSAIPLFKPRGELPMWQGLYDIAMKGTIGTEFGWQDLKVLTGFDIKSNAYRSLVYQANKHLLTDGKRMLKNIRGVGYKIALPNEQIEQGKWRNKRATRQVKAGISEVKNVNVDALSPDEKIRRLHLLNHLSESLGPLRRRTGTALKAQKSAIREQEKVVDQLDRLQKQLNGLKKSLL